MLVAAFGWPGLPRPLHVAEPAFEEDLPPILDHDQFYPHEVELRRWSFVLMLSQSQTRLKRDRDIWFRIMGAISGKSLGGLHTILPSNCTSRIVGKHPSWPMGSPFSGRTPVLPQKQDCAPT